MASLSTLMHSSLMTTRKVTMRHHSFSLFFAASVLAAGLSGCVPPVGGSCDYSEPVDAQVRVESLDEGYAVLRILTIEGPANVTEGDLLALPQPRDAVSVGDQRMITLRSRLTGSCNPISAHWAP